ncbi:MAG: branched-chain amino acid ABC transporter substrate-binding protein [Deltaproteobacteria bacterium]|nr:branched-chain amino acid ABC transporter substrate-binding protein [Deltaproteobacteria bacterium]
MRGFKGIVILISVFSFLCLTLYGPSAASAAKAERKSAKAEAAPGKLGKANASFDANKISDMTDFDPATWKGPEGDVIKIAYVNAFSGPGAINGQIHILPVMFAVHDINKRGGIWVDGKKKLITVIKADHMSKPDQCKKICERMVLQEKVHILMGTSGSHLMKIINEVANKYKIIAVNDGTLADDLMDATNFGRYSFMPSISTEQVGRGLAYYYGQIRKKEKKFYILCQDYSFGHEIADGFKKGLKEYFPEGQIVGEDYHKLFLTDYAPYLTKIKASGAEVIYTGDWPPDTGNLLKQARQLGITLPFANVFMNEPNELHEVGVEGTKGLVNLDQQETAPSFKDPARVKLHRAWHDSWKKWKTAPFNSRLFEQGTSNMGAYTMYTYWLLSVIERAKSTDPDKIAKVWEGDTYRMANGKIIKMRACDHKSIQDLLVTEFVPPEQQKVSFNIPPYYWFQGCSFSGPGYVIPAAKVLPKMDQKLDRCAGKDEWGE